MVVKLNKRKCKSCGLQFQKARPLQNTCSIPCAIDHANKLKVANKRTEDRLERVKTKNALDSIKTLSERLKDAQRFFNQWIRESKKGMNCISCDKPMLKKINAGHFLSIGAHPELRFEPDNCWPQCEYCNTFLSSNAVNYRKNLVKLIGIERVEWLESKHEPKRYRADDAIAIKVKYKQLTKELKDAKE
jgi:hypothetical protein